MNVNLFNDNFDITISSSGYVVQIKMNDGVFI